MSGKIIALVDGSIYATSVCEHAAWIAVRTGQPVELLHVIGRREGQSQADLSGAMGLGARTSLLNELAELDRQRSKLTAERGRAILDDARAILNKADVTTTVRLRDGDLLDTVAEAEHDASMILIGKRGEAADFAKGHLGSNLERIVRASRKPVFVASRACRPIKRVLLAWDQGAMAQKALEQIATSPLFKGLEIHIITIGQDTTNTRDGLSVASAMLKRAGLSVEVSVEPGQSETALGQLVEDQGFDMVVMGAYGHSRIRSLFIGSTTTAMIRSCKVPILLVR